MTAAFVCLCCLCWPQATLYGIVNVTALVFILAGGAAAKHVLGAVQELAASSSEETKATDRAMNILVRLEEVLSIINKELGGITAIYFAITFQAGVYYSLSVTFGIDAGSTGFIFMCERTPHPVPPHPPFEGFQRNLKLLAADAAIMQVIAAHVVLMPAAIASDMTVSLMNAINKLRYVTDEAGTVALASESTICEAECLSTFVRESKGRGGLGIYIGGMGKVRKEARPNAPCLACGCPTRRCLSDQKVFKVGSTLFTVLAFLAQALAPSDAAFEHEMLKLQRGHDTTATLLLEQRDLLDKLGDRLTQLESSCAAGGG